MTAGLSAFEKRLCNALQKEVPITKRPFARIAATLDTDEETILKYTRELVRRRVIRRMGPAVNWRAAGKATTLVAAHIGQKDLQKVVDAVNLLEGVSHNYLREHHYNLWFTLRADSQKQTAAILKKLSKQFGTAFNSLPAKRVFKLDVRFDALSKGQSLLQNKLARIKNRTVKLDVVDERILSKLNEELEATAQPYDFLCEDKLTIDEVLLRIKKMIDKGVIYQLGAVVNHHKLGFVANAMFVCKADESKIVKIGQTLARLKTVSHCYLRKTFKGWPYNLFAMMHGRSFAQIQHEINKFVKSRKITTWDALPTVEVLKKK
jgi:DNA-binding Lrp family transcriptional regulator